MKIYEGKLISQGIKIGIVAARFNEFIVSKLLSGCEDALLRHGVREEDIAVAAGILRGRHIPAYTRLIVVPASQEVQRRCMERGYIQDLMDAGATIAAPGCAACLGVHEGILAPGETCITSTNRNFPGRMGAKDAKLYLASPATVAASILNGKITDPRQYL